MGNRALQIRNDTRYKKMSAAQLAAEASHTPAGKDSSRTALEAPKEEGAERSSGSKTPHASATSALPSPRPTPRTPRFNQDDFGRVLQVAPPDVTRRDEWQETLGRSVKKLLLDFDLSEAPKCRLNHLERMHSWFQCHGKAAERNPNLGPNYLTTARYGPPPPGSTRGFTHTMSNATRALATAFPDIGSGRSPRGVLPPLA